MSPIGNSLPPGIRIVSDDDECERLWKALYPMESIFDLWDVRQIFSRQYRHKNYFIVHETEKKEKKNGNNGLGLRPTTNHESLDMSLADNSFQTKSFCDNKINCRSLPDRKEEREIDGFLPLCWIEAHDCFAFFPGETWNGRTWMEQNRIIANSREVIEKLLESIPGPAEIRYLRKEHVAPLLLFDDVEDGKVEMWDCSVDETGYLFFSGNIIPVHDTSDTCYSSLSHYLSCFSGKSRKKIISEIHAIEKQGVTFRYNCLEDMEILFQLNLKNFSDRSYFYDERFLNAFKELSRMLHQNGRLRVVTVLVDQHIAAVDMGVIWNNCCTLLAGGTSRAFPGIAKLINLHHIEWACSHNSSNKIESLDFLCGDFGWKERFHLSARPLYKITIPEFKPQGEKCYDHATFA